MAIKVSDNLLSAFYLQFAFWPPKKLLMFLVLGTSRKYFLIPENLCRYKVEFEKRLPDSAFFRFLSLSL